MSVCQFEASVARAVHCIHLAFGFESGLYLYLWDLFPLTVVPLPNVPSVINAEAKQLD